MHSSKPGQRPTGHPLNTSSHNVSATVELASPLAGAIQTPAAHSTAHAVARNLLNKHSALLPPESRSPRAVSVSTLATTPAAAKLSGGRDASGSNAGSEEEEALSAGPQAAAAPDFITADKKTSAADDSVGPLDLTEAAKPEATALTSGANNAPPALADPLIVPAATTGQINSSVQLLPQAVASPTALAGTAPWYGRYLTDLPNFGQTNTFFAMLPQGILACLLIFAWAEKGMEDAAWIPAIIFGAAALAGKYLLIEYLGRRNYIGLLDRLNPSHWQSPELSLATAQTATNYLFSLNAAGTFAYLAWISCVSEQGLGPKIRETFPDSNIATGFAEFFEFPLTWGICAAASLLANLLSFPVIHSLGIGALKEIAGHLGSNNEDEKAFLIAQAKLNYGLNRFIKLFNELNKEILKPSPFGHKVIIDISLRDICQLLERTFGKPQDAQYEAKNSNDKIIALLQQKRSNEELIKAFQGLADKEGFNPEVSIAASRASYLTAAACVGITAYGLSNFYGIGADMGSTVFHNEAMGKYVTGPMSVISMTVMSALTKEFGRKIGVEIFGGREHEREYPHILSSTKQSSIMAMAWIVCILGGTPNVFQSLYINQPIADMVFAEVASFNLELFGYLESRYDKHERNRLTKLDPELASVIKDSMGLIQGMTYSNASHSGPTAVLAAIKGLRTRLNACKGKPAPSESVQALLATPGAVAPIFTASSEAAQSSQSRELTA